MKKLLFRLAPVSILILALSLFTGLSAGTAAPSAQADAIPCMTGVAIQPLGSAMPADAVGLALVSMRLTIAPGGGFDPHMHPGILVVNVDEGQLDFTQIDDTEMSVNRAPVDGTPTPAEALVSGKEITLNAGDWFEEPRGMVHMAWNHTDQPTVVILAGLVDPDQPFVQCVETDSN